MLTVDYDYYSNTYKGDKISEKQWNSCSRNAAAYLDVLTLGRAASSLPDDLLDLCKMAICGMAEVYVGQENTDGELVSVTNGKYTETYAQTGKSLKEKLRDAAYLYLANTGLCYRGMDAPCCCAMNH